jgi:trehalose-6-phosphate synthase
MNLVAKEFVAAQDPADPGVLILSHLAGAAYELRQALLVNPFDIDDIAAALNRALEMTLEERRARWAELWRRLTCTRSRHGTVISLPHYRRCNLVSRLSTSTPFRKPERNLQS